MVKEGITVDMVDDVMGFKIEELKDVIAGNLVVMVLVMFFAVGSLVGDEAVIGAEGVGGLTDAAFRAMDGSTADEAGGRDEAFRGIDAVGFEDFVYCLPGSSVAFGDGFHGGKVLVVGDDDLVVGGRDFHS